jgi:hypothetical protein
MRNGPVPPLGRVGLGSSRARSNHVQGLGNFGISAFQFLGVFKDLDRLFWVAHILQQAGDSQVFSGGLVNLTGFSCTKANRERAWMCSGLSCSTLSQFSMAFQLHGFSGRVHRPGKKPGWLL